MIAINSRRLGLSGVSARTRSCTIFPRALSTEALMWLAPISIDNVLMTQPSRVGSRRTISLSIMKSYDQAYFERWYRDPADRVSTRASLERKVRMAVGVAEFLLGRPIRTVLDVGCGEAPWFPVLRRLRPRIRYTGVDSS